LISANFKRRRRDIFVETRTRIISSPVGAASSDNQSSSDLKIANRRKDMFFDQNKKERNVFFDQLPAANRKAGDLEMKLLQMELSKTDEN
jgi:hypothetical protein